MIRKHIFESGLRVLLIPMRETATVTVYVLAGTGSRDEEKKEGGISHFLEHMCFKGTKRRPSAFDITRELDSLGSQSNAFTGHEYTGYYAKSHFEHLPQLIDIVSDIYLHSTFPESEVKKECGVIIEEMNMYNDRPDHVADEAWRMNLYGDTPIGRTIIGIPESVRTVTQKSLIEYHKMHYHAGNTVVVIAGHFDEERTLALARSAFAPITQQPETKRLAPKLPTRKGSITSIYRKSDQAHIVVGVPGYSANHKDKYALTLLSGVLGAGMSSRLFQKLREEMGAAYYVYSHASYATDCGHLQVAAGVDKKKVKEIMMIIRDELARFAKEDVPEDELERVKEYLIGNMYLNLESTDEFGEFFGIQEVMRRPLEMPDEKEKKVRAVTASDIRRVATDLLTKRGLVASVVGPFKVAPIDQSDLML